MLACGGDYTAFPKRYRGIGCLLYAQDDAMERGV
jgi:hypothetical protein